MTSFLLCDVMPWAKQLLRRKGIKLRADSHLTSGQEQRELQVPKAPKLPAGCLALSWLFPLTLLRPVSVSLCCYDKTLAKINMGRKEFTTSWSLESIIKGSEDKNQKAATLEEILLPGLCSDTVFRQPTPT